jgi:ketosteroid isomerase-like protein
MRLIIILAIVSSLVAWTRPQATQDQEAQIRNLVQRWVTEINTKQSTNVLDEFLAHDYVWHLPGEDIVGVEAVKEVFAQVFAANDSFHLTAEDVVIGGNTVVIRWTATGVRRESGERWQTAGISIDRVNSTQFLEGWEISSANPWVAPSRSDADSTAPSQ